MVYALLVFSYRRPDVSPTQFQHHLETTHLSMLKELIGELWPIQHSFRYPARAGSGIGDRAGAPAMSKEKVEPDVPVVITGDPSDGDVQWDVITEWVFRDELHFQQALARLNEPGIGDRLKDDEELFSLPEKLKIVVLSDIKDTREI